MDVSVVHGSQAFWVLTVGSSWVTLIGITTELC